MNQDNIAKYCNCMEEIKRRADVVADLFRYMKTIKDVSANLESICLQIRKILELIALASLVAHKEEYAKQYDNFAKHWRAKAILDSIEKLNPNFYPVPTNQIVRPGEITETLPIKEPYLKREEFPEVYDKCSGAIHCPNPFGDAVDYMALFRDIPGWMEKIFTLLNHHEIKLYNEQTRLFVVMNAIEDGRVHAAFAVREGA